MLISENLKFVFQKTVGRFVEKTILGYVLRQVNENVAIPLLRETIEFALAHDQPEVLRHQLLNVLARLDQPGGPPAVAVMPPMWARDP